MANHVSPLEQAAATRDLARRARRLAQTQSMGSGRARLHQYAEELEERATRLEAEADELTRTTLS
jgi:plasmid stabilization system protein ParE